MLKAKDVGFSDQPARCMAMKPPKKRGQSVMELISRDSTEQPLMSLRIQHRHHGQSCAMLPYTASLALSYVRLILIPKPTRLLFYSNSLPLPQMS
jgi:hypothetical protein